ncbi:MAG: BatD family protein [Planctomycetes bacterium]|nr:BatD family protein [Planctomycetota bacterium]MCC7172309.1 BatD family protein [Planctomycetota bacterium]
MIRALAIWIFAVASALASGVRPELRCALAHARLFIGESTELTFIVSDAESEPTVDVSALTQFEVEKLGAQRFSNAQLRIVNGQVTQSEQRGFEIVYRLTPRAAGILRIPSLTVKVDGESIDSQPLALRVDPPTPTELAYVTTDLLEAPKYPMQRAVLRVRVFLHRLPGEYVKTDPLQGTARLQLECPFFDVPDGWRAELEVRDWLGPRAKAAFRATVGFEINGYSPQSPGLSLFGGGQALFSLDGRPATAADVASVPALDGRHADYYVYELTRTFQPRRSGRVSFPPAALKGGVCATVKGDEPQRELVYVVGEPLEVVVPELPTAGRPDGFVGAIGRVFAIEGAVLPRRCRVGDPVVYTLTLRGQGNLEEVEPPDFAALPAFSERFAVETPTAENGTAERILRATLRPRVAGEIEVPAIPFAYFDTERGEYVQVQSNPVPLTVEAVAALGAGSITSGAPITGTPTAITRAAGAFPDVDDPARVRNDQFPKRAYASIAGALPLAWLAVLLLAHRRRAHAQDPHRLRRKTAAETARSRMRQAKASADALDPAREALVGLVAAAAGVSEAALASKDVRRVLETAGVDAALVARVTAWFERHDGARFGGGEAARAMVDEAAVLVDELAAALTVLRRIGT